MQRSKAVILVGALMIISGVASADLNTGLVANWSFDDCTAKDVSGNGHDGVVNGSPNCEAGIKGKAFSFNGSSDYIQVENSDSLNMNQAISFGGFVKLTELTGYDAADIILNKEGSPFELAIHNIETTPICVPDVIPKYDFVFYMDIQQKISPCWADGGKKVSKNKWTHLFVTYDNSQIKTYFNGVLVKTYPMTGPITNSVEALRIAARGGYGEPTSFFNGMIDELRIYNRALSKAEVSALYRVSISIGSPTTYGFKKFEVVCSNNTTGKNVIMSNRTSAWDCGKSGLVINPTDSISITINGKAY